MKMKTEIYVSISRKILKRLDESFIHKSKYVQSLLLKDLRVNGDEEIKKIIEEKYDFNKNS